MLSHEADSEILVLLRRWEMDPSNYSAIHIQGGAAPLLRTWKLIIRVLRKRFQTTQESNQTEECKHREEANEATNMRNGMWKRSTRMGRK